jgi:phage shock protein C
MNQKRLQKSDDKILLGVCGGIAEFIGWSKKTVRLLWVVFTFFGVGIFAYPILGLIMPSSTDNGSGFDIDNYRAE